MDPSGGKGADVVAEDKAREAVWELHIAVYLLASARLRDGGDLPSYVDPAAGLVVLGDVDHLASVLIQHPTLNEAYPEARMVVERLFDGKEVGIDVLLRLHDATGRDCGRPMSL